MTTARSARKAGRGAPAARDEAPNRATGRGPDDQNDTPNCLSAPHSRQALRIIEGERKAAAFLDRWRAQQADPDELALIVAALYGDALCGFCRAIVKALGVSHA